MSRRIAILAALPRELKPLVRGWSRQDAPQHVSLWKHVDEQGDELAAACAGMGAEAARRAFAVAEAAGSLDLVISVGLAGATGLAPLPVGSVSAVTAVIDASTGERFALNGGDRHLRLATVPRTAGSLEKRRLADTYGAVLVDMEAATVARLATMRGLPMCCFKAVSDLEDTVLPEIDAFVTAGGQLRVAPFAFHLALRPRYWAAVRSLARASAGAAESLAEQTQMFLQHKDWNYTNRTGNFEKP